MVFRLLSASPSASPVVLSLYTERMKVLILSYHDVESLLPLTECIPVMSDALSALARGEAQNPLRSLFRPQLASGFLGLMPAFSSGRESHFGLKEVCVFPGNPSRGLDTHLGAVLLHDGETGELRAVINASAVTAIRTAAVSAVATKLLAREDASVLAVIGAGTQARAHLLAIPAVRPIRKIRIVSRTRKKAEELAASGQNSIAVEVVDSVEKAVSDADIIVTATSSREPVLQRSWISDGTHINAVGSSIPTAREIDSRTMADASIFVDRRESTLNESGDFLMAVKDGALTSESIRGEIGELLIGAIEGRRSSSEITLFKSLGLAIEDLAAAQYLFRKAQQSGTGSLVDF